MAWLLGRVSVLEHLALLAVHRVAKHLGLRVLDDPDSLVSVLALDDNLLALDVGRLVARRVLLLGIDHLS